jgi:hypothetical protein
MRLMGRKWKIFLTMVAAAFVASRAGPATAPRFRAGANVALAQRVGCGRPLQCGDQRSPDDTGTAALTVRHETSSLDPNLTRVMVDSSAESWRIRAFWATDDSDANCRCDSISEDALADVTWNAADSRWTVACTGCTGDQPAIRHLLIATPSSCPAPARGTHSWTYRLRAHTDLDTEVRCRLHLARLITASRPLLLIPDSPSRAS